MGTGPYGARVTSGVYNHHTASDDIGYDNHHTTSDDDHHVASHHHFASAAYSGSA